MRLLKLFLVSLTVLSLWSCTSKRSADLIVHNGKVYAMNGEFSILEAFAVKDGKILEVNSSEYILHKYKADSVVDAQQKPVYPGFIDGHAHFVSYGSFLMQADLFGTTSWDAVLAKLSAFAQKDSTGWIIGRGWDQNDWAVQHFPTNEKLNQLFPDRPVYLSRVDGHAAIVNNKALEIAGLTKDFKILGGEAEVKNGKLTGILIDNAMDAVAKHIPDLNADEFKEAVIAAQQNCYAMGITSITECGLNYETVELIDSLQKSKVLTMPLYVMLADADKNYDYLSKKGIIKTDALHVRGFKLYGDGALGSRGACLLNPYHDKPGHYGFLLSEAAHYDKRAAQIKAGGFQMCTHAIGDSSNRVLLNTYAKHLIEKNDLRWRIEHAQVVNENDFALFGKYSIIPSVQPTHATSDMYWAGKRLGAKAEKGAYAFKQLLDQNGWITLGTDFPVEDISPFKTFLAAVIRKDANGYPASGYQMENALSRKETLYGMTIWAAKANFEENERGSLEAGKWADFIILNNDLMDVAPTEILNTKVLQTFVKGKNVYAAFK